MSNEIDSQIIGRFVTFLIPLIILALPFNIIPASIIRADAQRRGMESIFWFWYTLIFSFLGVILYMAVRREAPLPVAPALSTKPIRCPNCNKAMAIPPDFTGTHGKCIQCGAAVPVAAYNEGVRQSV